MSGPSGMCEFVGVVLGGRGGGGMSSSMVEGGVL